MTGDVDRRALHRAGLLLALVTGGGLAGYAGFALTGSQTWFLCLPGAVALGWLAVADPDRCMAARQDPTLPPPPDDTRRGPSAPSRQG